MADNVFSSAQIRIEAETTKAEQALKDLRGQMDQLGKSLDDLAAKQKAAGDAGEEFGRVNQSLGEVKKSLKDVSDLMSVLAKLEAPVRIARDFYQLGTEIEAVAEKLLGIPDDVGAAMTALADEDKSPAQLLRKQIKELEKEWLDGGVIEQWKRAGKVIQDALFGWSTEAEYDQRFSAQRELLKKSLADQESDALRAAAELAAKKNELATKSTKERLQGEMQLEIDAAKEKYKQFADLVIPGIRARKQAEIDALEEVAKKREELAERARQKELDEIAQRRDAYMNLIREQQAANQKLAEQAAEAMTKALSQVASGFGKMFESQLGQMAFTIEGLAANVEKIANQRRAAG